jgi:hypothetical protein
LANEGDWNESETDDVKNVINMTVVATCLMGYAASAQAPVRPGFDIQNASNSPITGAFAKPMASQKWGSLLPGSSVAVGRTARVNVTSETNCLYDVRLLFADGHEESRRHVDICKHDRVRTTDGGK